MKLYLRERLRRAYVMPRLLETSNKGSALNGGGGRFLRKAPAPEKPKEHSIRWQWGGGVRRKPYETPL